MKMSESATGNCMTCKDIVNRHMLEWKKMIHVNRPPRKADGRLKNFGLALLNMLERAKENLV